MVAKVLTRIGDTVRYWEMIYKLVVQTILLYGSDIWVVAGAMLQVLEGFCHQAAKRIMGKTDRRTVDREWECPPVEFTMEISGIWIIKE